MLMLLCVHMTSVLFLVLAGNFTLTMGFYWSYTLLLYLPVLMRSWWIYWSLSVIVCPQASCCLCASIIACLLCFVWDLLHATTLQLRRSLWKHMIVCSVEAHCWKWIWGELSKLRRLVPSNRMTHFRNHVHKQERKKAAQHDCIGRLLDRGELAYSSHSFPALRFSIGHKAGQWTKPFLASFPGSPG